MKIMVIDMDGTHLKPCATNLKRAIEFPSGPTMTGTKKRWGLQTDWWLEIYRPYGRLSGIDAARTHCHREATT